MLFSFFSCWIFSKVIDVPAVPEKFVLEDAFIYRGLSKASKTTSYLYLRVGLDDEAYNYIIEVSNRDIGHLDLSSLRKLLVAVDSDRKKHFVWWIYDENGVVLISRKEILQWVKSNNSANYFTVFTWSVLSLYLLFLIFRYGIWNRVLAKRK